MQQAQYSRRTLSLWLLLSLTACSAAPPIFIHTRAAQLGFERRQVQGKAFPHTVYLKGSLTQAQRVHVYLEGDGQPWIRHKIVARDPTPRDSLMLKLMDQDPTPALYLGRPCYHGFSTTTPCNPLLWTLERYSPRIVDSMVMALQHVLTGNDAHITLIGHSGGGTLAMLMARHLPRVTTLVTLAGNLDIDAWTDHHHYSPLSGSLNPATQPPLRSGIRQLHLAGADDTNIPLSALRAAVKRQPRASLRVLDRQDHGCCWHKIWSEFLSELEQNRNTLPP